VTARILAQPTGSLVRTISSPGTPTPTPQPSTPPASTSPAGSSAAICYFGSDDGSLYAVDTATGIVRWIYKTGGSPSPTVVGGIVYTGGDQSVYALNPTGPVLWQQHTAGTVSSPPAVAGDSVYADIGGGLVYALDAATGNIRWIQQTGTSSSSWSPTVVSGVVYTCGGDGVVYALNAASGTIL